MNVIPAKPVADDQQMAIYNRELTNCKKQLRDLNGTITAHFKQMAEQNYCRPNLALYWTDLENIVNGIRILKAKVDAGKNSEERTAFQDRIKQCYQDLIYPMILNCKNARQGWQPTNVLCQMSNMWALWTNDPIAEVDAVFPIPKT
ncbi:MAG: hypothetical protein WCF19_01610 [Chlamydiales bacterium]